MLGCGNIDDAVDDTVTPKDFLIAVVEIGDALEAIPEEREKTTDEISLDDNEAKEIPAEEEREGTEADTNMLEKVSLEGRDETKEVEMLLDGDDAATQHSEMTNHVLSVTKLPNELDFDGTPTELFLSLQRKDWSSALVRAQNAPEEACIWISRKEDDNESIRWRLLPIHAAIIFGAPAHVTEVVLECFTLGARARDDQGMLPLHLIFRQGGQQEVVNMLLKAFPGGVGVENSKGRTPMDIAKASSSPHRDAYVEALSSSAEAASVLSDAELANVHTEHEASMTEQRTAFESKIEEMRKSQEEEIKAYQTESSEIQTKLLGTITSLEDDMVRTQENSQIIVDHVADLEAQLDSRSVTERFLATRISNLHAFLKDTSKSKEDVEVRLKQEIAQLFEEKLELQKTVSKLHEEKSETTTSFIASQSKLNDVEASLAEAVKAKDEALFKLREGMSQVYAEKLIMQETISDLRTDMGGLTSDLEETKAKLMKSEDVSKAEDIAKMALEAELVSVKEQRAVLQEEMATTVDSIRYKRLQAECDTLRIESVKLKEERDMRMTNEQALSSRVSTLALQLADNMQDTSSEKSVFSTKMFNLESERTELRDTVAKLSNKLVAVAGHIDAMTKEQQVIVDQVSAQEREIAAAASDQAKIFSLIKVQEKFFSKMQEEGKHLAVAAKQHKKAIVDRDTTIKRGELVRTVTLLKHQMIGAIDSALAGIPKTVNDDEDMVDQIMHAVKCAPKSAWSNKIQVNNKNFEADVKSALEAQEVIESEGEEEQTADPVAEETFAELVAQISEVEEDFVTGTSLAETQNSAYFMEEEKKDDDDDDTLVDPTTVSVVAKIAMLEQWKKEEKA